MNSYFEEEFVSALYIYGWKWLFTLKCKNKSDNKSNYKKINWARMKFAGCVFGFLLMKRYSCPMGIIFLCLLLGLNIGRMWDYILSRNKIYPWLIFLWPHNKREIIFLDHVFSKRLKYIFRPYKYWKVRNLSLQQIWYVFSPHKIEICYFLAQS